MTTTNKADICTTPGGAKPMMTCGHAANATHDGKPSCAICLCSTIATDAPDLTGRRARCGYYGGTSRGPSRGPCTSEAPSATGLAFFEYLGPGSRRAQTMCTCGMALVAHLATFRVEARTTYRAPDGGHRDGRTVAITVNAADSAGAMLVARAELAQLVGTRDFLNGATIARADVLTIVETRGPQGCGTFTAAGPAPFDSFYCGCRGWD